MARVIIVIEDVPHGAVKVTSTPDLDTMIRMNVEGGELTNAHGYAAFALNRIQKQIDDDNKILRNAV